MHTCVWVRVTLALSALNPTFAPPLPSNWFWNFEINHVSPVPASILQFPSAQLPPRPMWVKMSVYVQRSFSKHSFKIMVRTAVDPSWGMLVLFFKATNFECKIFHYIMYTFSKQAVCALKWKKHVFRMMKKGISEFDRRQTQLKHLKQSRRTVAGYI